MHIHNHWLDGATHISSPNFDARPDADDISLIVVHCISLPPGEFGGPFIDRLFCNRLEPGDHPYFQGIYRLKVSAHLFIRRDGQIVQYVAFDKRAWHAGVSEYRGRGRCNDFSVGIELEGTDGGAFDDRQYSALSAAIATLLRHYPGLSRQRIAGHSDIAPERKTDPGTGFDWVKLRGLLGSG
jgi:AmpD protein